MTLDSEILTRGGWKTWMQVRPGDQVVSFNPVEKAFGHTPIARIHLFRNPGPLIGVLGRSVNLLVLPTSPLVMRRFQHNTERYKLYDWTLCTANLLPQMFQVHTGGAPEGPGMPGITDEELRVLGWVLTDGCIHGRTKNRVLTMCQSSTTKKCGLPMMAEMDAVLHRLGVRGRYPRPARVGPPVNPKYGPVIGAPSLAWYFGESLSARFREWLAPDLHRVSRRVLERCNHRQLRVLYEGLLEGDGTSEKGRWRNFTPGDGEGLADDFQEIATRLGIRTVKSRTTNGIHWRVSIAYSEASWIQSGTSLESGFRHVWSVDVDAPAFVARRNGKVSVYGVWNADTIAYLTIFPPSAQDVVEAEQADTAIQILEGVTKKGTVRWQPGPTDQGDLCRLWASEHIAAGVLGLKKPLGDGAEESVMVYDPAAEEEARQAS